MIPGTAFFLVSMQNGIFDGTLTAGAIGGEPYCEFPNHVASALKPFFKSELILRAFRSYPLGDRACPSLTKITIFRFLLETCAIRAYFNMLTREANASLVMKETSLVATNNLPRQKYSTVNFMRKSRQPMTAYLTLVFPKKHVFPITHHPTYAARHITSFLRSHSSGTTFDRRSVQTTPARRNGVAPQTVTEARLTGASNALSTKILTDKVGKRVMWPNFCFTKQTKTGWVTW